jgi:integrase
LIRWDGLPASFATGLDVHLDDLRHTGNQLTADAGANLRELMERMGHSSSRAALIYLHSTSDRQRQLAETVAVRVKYELGKPDKTETNRVARVWHDSESTDGETP